jgi:hypothetical protein
MIEHFRVHTAHRIGGKAKAMAVTDSRVAAVKYKRAFDKYISDMGYLMKAVVAFSGTVKEDIAGEVTESSLNGFPDTQTAVRFKGAPPFKVGDYRAAAQPQPNRLARMSTRPRSLQLVVVAR